MTVILGKLTGEKLDFAWKKNSAGTLSFPTAGCYLCNIQESVWRNSNAHNLFEKLDRFPVDYTGSLTLADVLEEQDQLPPLSMFSQLEFSVLVFGSLARIEQVLSRELRTILKPILLDGVSPLTQAQ